MGGLAAEKHIQYILTVEKVCFIHILFYSYDLPVSWVAEMILLSFMSKFNNSEEGWFCLCCDGTFENEWGILGIDHSGSFGKAWHCRCGWGCFMGHEVPARVRFVEILQFLHWINYVVWLHSVTIHQWVRISCLMVLPKIVIFPIYDFWHVCNHSISSIN